MKTKTSRNTKNTGGLHQVFVCIALVFPSILRFPSLTNDETSQCLSFPFHLVDFAVLWWLLAASLFSVSLFISVFVCWSSTFVFLLCTFVCASLFFYWNMCFYRTWRFCRGLWPTLIETIFFYKSLETFKHCICILLQKS